MTGTGAPRQRSRWLVVVSLAPVVLACVWCGFGYRIRAGVVRRTTDRARLRDAARSVIADCAAQTSAGGALFFYGLDARGAIPPALREWDPERVVVTATTAEVVLGGTVGGDFGFVAYAEGAPRDAWPGAPEDVPGLVWFCTE